MSEQPTVLVVGAGPTGLAAANLLGKHGISTVVVEREADVATEPRAVSIDDEAMRLLQAIGLADGAAPGVLPGRGTRYYGARGQRLAASGNAAISPYGHAPKNPIDHGAFTRTLLDGLAARSCVDVHFGAEIEAFELEPDGVVATVRRGGGSDEVRARYLLGCDGGRSAIRRELGVKMTGRSIQEPWLVIDTVGDPHDQRYAMHYGNPARPHVVLPGGGGRCRYEFLLHPGEDERTATSFATAQRLLAPHRPALTPADVIRQRVYVFHALLANRWRRGPAFLLGDAAHMMPPFAGQGLTTGLRDALNLAWKLAAVERGQLGEAVLDSYERERRPHAQAMIELSMRRGRVMMTTNRAVAGARDAAVAVARCVPPLRRRLEHLPVKPPPRHADGLVIRVREREPAIVGAMLPQPGVLLPEGQVMPLDDVLGPWFALIAVEPAPRAFAALRSPLWERLGARRLRLWPDERFPAAGGDDEPQAVADLDRLLAPALAGCAGEVVVVRPDRFVAGVFRPELEHSFVERWRALDPTIDPLSPLDAIDRGLGPAHTTARSTP